MYDFIGDVHGHAAELRKLLSMMDYHEVSGVYRHPTRKAFFLGDYIDRGPRVKESVDLIRAMVNAGTAKAIMGNHEFNALCFHTASEAGGFVRPHSAKNIEQHQATLDAYADKDELGEALDWMLTLPLYY